MNIQWYPGHMTKTRRMMEENQKLIDIVVELLDARIPFSSKNPDIDRMSHTKPKIMLLNKSDLADPNSTDEWIKYYRSENVEVIPVCAQTGITSTFSDL